MYDYIEGQVAQRAAGRVVIDAGGIGFDICTPLNATLPASGRVRVWTHQVVRDDAHLLFGFAEAGDRDVFRALLSVTGVGPKVALAVMSGMPCVELVEALITGDVARLTKVRGVGRRTAEQILLDLRNKALALRKDSEQPARSQHKALEDAVAALLSIGFTEKEARKQVERAAKSVDPTDLDLLVRAALAG